ILFNGLLGPRVQFTLDTLAFGTDPIYGNILYGTYGVDGSTHLTKYDLNGDILFNGLLGPHVQFTLNTLAYGTDPIYGNILYGTYGVDGSTHLTKYDLDGDILFNGLLGPRVQFTLDTLTFIPDLNTATAVPEPTSFALLTFGLVGLGIGRARLRASR
ncbi:MAG TPA: PEP-CTERM sorting domain-containing protein, partial [Acetobacteraceae bacterium]